MKLYKQVSVFGVAFVLAAALASAETIQLGSYQTGGPNLGNNNSAVAYLGSPSTTYALSPGTAWAPAGANSVWVSNNPGSGPGGNYVAPSGNYSYTTTFNTITGNTYTGSISVLADDTTSIIFNGHTLALQGLLGTDAHCADGTPNCVTPTLIALPSAFFLDGLNTLQFDLRQTILSAGLDFYGSASGVTRVGDSAVPEPGTLFLLGTGLIGSAGFLLRRSRA
ncbi:MAG TPA: PEP-CTERM sorting domain-containing protein [Tepidisphaeraceae bacterium]|nr:PEP-CTERM sorting domain-containing protein [Tepidisphaeraceae bacterium]